jgi:hypothetical protein
MALALEDLRVGDSGASLTTVELIEALVDLTGASSIPCGERLLAKRC